MRALSPRHVAVSLALVVVAGPSAALADSAPAREQPLSDSLKGPAKDAYSSARILFNNGDFAGAVAKYGQAYQLSKEPRLLFDMAICEKNLRHYARMQRHLEEYERDAGAALTAEHKASVDAALGAVKNLVASVVVSVNVAGAAVSVDGELAGTSPLASPVIVDLGRHAIAATKAGYDGALQTIEIAGGGQQVAALTLVAQVRVGRLRITAEHEATIEVDGQTAGVDRYERPLSVGPHAIRVTAPGKIPYEADVELHDRELRTIEVTLTPDTHAKAPIWPWIAGGAATAAGLAVGGYFLFRPHDETKPVPAGTFYSIQFSQMRFR